MVCKHLEFTIMHEDIIPYDKQSIIFFFFSSSFSCFCLFLFCFFYGEREPSMFAVNLVGEYPLTIVFLAYSLNSKPSPFIISAISSPFSENILAFHCVGPLFTVNSEDKSKRSQQNLGKLEIYGFTFHSLIMQ